jgi:UDP:flavonoid glycosyltransferase YjiC (YdhE family)
LIFPHCAVVIHHGGAGTTQASLLAGAPSVVVAHIADQPFWGHELQRLGVGAKPMSRFKMTSERLASAIQSVTQNTEITRNARSISLQMKKENGVSNAIHALLSLTQHSR